jgi:hypothetical protein
MIEIQTTWIRQGECSHCGECCHGCALFRPDNEKKCGEYGGELYGNQDCNIWPWHPSQIGPGTIKPSCTFFFVEAENGN